MRTRYAPARARRWFRLTGWLALVLLLQQPVQALAQAAAAEYRLQGGDEIVLSVPGRQDLDRTLTLDASGRVSIPQVGEVALSGLTVPEAREILRQRLRVFYPSIAAVDVELQGASQFRLYVLGEVRTSGHYDFGAMPTVWDLLRSAGGPTENANLGGGRIVRVVDGQTVVVPIDLSGVMSGGGSPAVELFSGDTLVVPTAAEGGTTVAAIEGIQVFGAVNTPVVVGVEQPTELVQLLMLAGAPMTTSDLRNVYWVHREADGFRSTKVNVRRYLEEGDRLGNPIVYPGDTIEVRVYEEPWLARRLPLILGVVATTATVLLAYDRLYSDP